VRQVFGPPQKATINGNCYNLSQIQKIDWRQLKLCQNASSEVSVAGDKRYSLKPTSGKPGRKYFAEIAIPARMRL
jgi:hypothetical protein